MVCDHPAFYDVRKHSISKLVVHSLPIKGEKKVTQAQISNLQYYTRLDKKNVSDKRLPQKFGQNTTKRFFFPKLNHAYQEKDG